MKIRIIQLDDSAAVIDVTGVLCVTAVSRGKLLRHERETLEWSGFAVQPDGCSLGVNGCDRAEQHFRGLAG